MNESDEESVEVIERFEDDESSTASSIATSTIATLHQNGNTGAAVPEIHTTSDETGTSSSSSLQARGMTNLTPENTSTHDESNVPARTTSQKNRQCPEERKTKMNMQIFSGHNKTPENVSNGLIRMAR